MLFLPFPHEIVVHILSFLDLVDLLKCRQLCRLVQGIIDTEAILQYQVALTTGDLVDGNIVRPIADRLHLLNQYQVAWSTLEWVQLQEKIDITELYDDLRWDLRGNVFARHIGTDTIQFHQLPSLLRGVPPRPPWETTAVFDIYDFAYDPDQDLLIALEGVTGGVEDSLYDIARLHILSMKSGEAHPESTTAMVPIRGFTDFEPTIASDCVVDSFFGILLQGHEEPICELRVLNWRTGEWYFSVTHEQMSDFAFLDERHILVAFGSTVPEFDDEIEATLAPCIQLYAFADEAGDHLPPLNTSTSMSKWYTHGRHIGSLGLPRIQSSSSVLEIIFHGNSLSTKRAPVRNGEVFQASEHHRIFLVEMVIEAQDDELPAVMCIPQHILLEYAHSMAQSAQPIEVPWCVWGPVGSRLFFGSVVDVTWSCPAYGSRFVASRTIENAPGDLSLEIQVYDFGHLAVKRGLMVGDRMGSWVYEDDPEDVNRPRFIRDVGNVSDYFIDDVSTRLPFRWLSKRREQSLGHGHAHAVMLSEDNILVVSTDDPEDQHITLLNF